MLFTKTVFSTRTEKAAIRLLYLKARRCWWWVDGDRPYFLLNVNISYRTILGANNKKSPPLLVPFTIVESNEQLNAPHTSFHKERTIL